MGSQNTYKITNARLTPDSEPVEIYVKDDIIKDIGSNLNHGAKTIDCGGNLIMPGLIDLNCHICDPGYEYKEDFNSISRAVSAAGYTTITCQPDLRPVADNKAVIEYVISKSIEHTNVNIIPHGSMTLEMAGKEISEIGEMHADGILAISDGGVPVDDANLLRTIMIYSKMFDIPVITSCCEKSIANKGVINEGYISTLTGLRGIPREAEEIHTARNLVLADYTEAHLHLTQVSTEGSIFLIRLAKKRGVNVTCDTSPHYFTLTDAVAQNYNTFAKTNPPLRTQRDIDAILEGLADGTIDAISSGHSPTTIERKQLEFDAADYGISSLETVFALSYTHLVKTGVLTFAQLVDKLCTSPANILGLTNRGRLQKDCRADLALFDIDNDYTIRGADFKSKARFTPHEGAVVCGKALRTFTSEYWYK